jgi:hypothetical protein
VRKGRSSRLQEHLRHSESEMKNYFKMLCITIPLKEDNGNLSGNMFRFVREPRHIPRIGERISVLPGKSLEVTDVIYDGPGIRSIHLYLEPLQQEFQKDLENTLSLQGKHSWRKAISR